MSYFSTLERQAELRRVALSWQGTPMRPHTAVKGRNGGVDCVCLIAAVMGECGVPHDFQPPDYSLDWGSHCEESLLLKYLRAADVVEELADGTAPLPGDILTFKIGKTEHHGAILLPGGEFIHAVKRGGVILNDLADPAWAQRVSKIFRVQGVAS